MAGSTQLTTSKRLPKSLLNEGQDKAITALYEGNVLLYALMRTGKTIVAASAITELLDDKHLTRVLIVTTPKIANNVWRQEFDKWEHTSHINVGIATGKDYQRLSVINCKAHQVVVMSFNTLPWAKENKVFEHFDGLLIDEVTKLVTPGGKWVKSIKHPVKKFKWVAELTGTPVNESFEKLYIPIQLLDGGEALGTRKDLFLRKYFYPTDFKQYNWELKPGADKEITDKIKHLIHAMPKPDNALLEVNEIKIKLQLPPKLRSIYEKIKKTSVYEDIVAPTRVATEMKLRQLVSGFIYDNDVETRRISDYRFTALLELLETIKGNVIIYYCFQEDKERLFKLLPGAKPFTEENKLLWDQGKIKYFILSPFGAGHGLDLYKGGNTIIWFDNQNSNDVWQQANARLNGRGQKEKVNVYNFETENTVDEVVNLRVENKQEYDKLFSKHLRG